MTRRECLAGLLSTGATPTPGPLSPGALLCSALLPAIDSIHPAHYRPFVPFLLSVAHLETRLVRRQQVRGHARGLWQFMLRGGVAEVLTNRRTSERALRFLGPVPQNLTPARYAFARLLHDDFLAAAYAVLLLRALAPQAPAPVEPRSAWTLYLSVWRPGVRAAHRWPESWQVGQTAWASYLGALPHE